MPLIATAAYQMREQPHWRAWKDQTERWVAEAAEHQAELLLFPEYGSMELATLSGAAQAADLEKSLHAVSDRFEEAQDHWQHLAQQYDVVLLMPSGPYFAYANKRPVNRAVLLGPQGIIGYQDKQIMTRFESEEWDILPGQEGLSVFSTRIGQVGILICYDSEFPLLARRLVDAGAEILLVPSCTETLAGYHRVRIGSMARSLENQCYSVMSSLVGECPWSPAVDVSFGRGGIFAPPDKGMPSDGVMAQGDMNVAAWTYAQIDVAAIHHVREQGTVINYKDWALQTSS